MNTPEPLRDLTIFIMSSIFSFDTISVVVPDTKVFLWIIASVAAAINPNRKSTISPNSKSTSPMAANFH